MESSPSPSRCPLSAAVHGGSSLAGKDADSLSVTPAADTVIETVAANGKTYDYFWWGEATDDELWQMVLAEEAHDLMEREGREPAEQEMEQARAV